MHTQDGSFVADAVAALATREYQSAGDCYSRAAWHVLAEPRAGVSPFAADERGSVGTAVQYLVLSAVCYRVADAPARATNRAVEAIAVARDLKTALSQPIQQACLDELVADCHVVGDLDGAADAYATAEDAYRTAGADVSNPQKWATAPLFEAAAAPIKQLARSGANGELAITWEDLHGADPDDSGAFFAHRTRYKHQRFASLVEGVVADGFLAAPRGTTEYATTHHRCPACDSTDVNWVADSTLCLRCSHPTEPT